jgi:muconolactone D-isomerase
MEFLVRIDVSLPGSMTAEERADLAAAELAHGLELCRRGTIQRIWRLPGGLRNVGIWEAPNATELHEAISGLPMFPWLRVEVTALARHPLEADDSPEPPRAASE